MMVLVFVLFVSLHVCKCTYGCMFKLHHRILELKEILEVI